MATFTSKINGNDIYAKRAEATRKGVNLETYGEGEGQVKGILPDGLLPGAEGTNEANTLATQQYVLDQMGEVAEALIFKGTIGAAADSPTVTELPAAHKVGWTYKVATAGTYAGKACELGDMIICVKNGTVAADDDWTVVQNNIDGAVTGPVSGSVVDGELAAFNGTTGKIIKGSGKSVVTTVGGSSTNAEVPTAAAVNTAITGAVAALDANVSSAAGTKVQVNVVEADGVITGVTVTETGLTSALAAKADKVSEATEGNFAGLDASGNLTDSGHKHSDYKTKQTAVDESGSALKTLTRIQQDANGVITPTFADIPSAATNQAGVVQLAGSIGATVASENNKAATEKAVRDAIDALDVDSISGLGAGKTITALSETDGKIAATASDIAITGAQVTVASATSGNFAGLDASGHVVDSGKKAADFKTKQTAVVDPSASGNASEFIATISQNANGEITATKAIIPTAQPTSGGVTHPGMVTYETVEL